MNPSFPIQRTGVVNSPAPLITDPHLSNPSPPPSNQWAALNTNPQLQRTLCKAAASGQLTQDQMMSFSAYMRGNPSTHKMFQMELQAHHQQQQQQQLQQLKRQQLQQHSEQEKSFQQPPHQIVNNNGYILNSHPTPQAQIPMSSTTMAHYQQPIGSSPQQQAIQQQRLSDMSIVSNDSALTQLLTQFTQLNEERKNPNLSPAEQESNVQRSNKLHELISVRMSQLGIRNVTGGNNSPSPAASGSNQLGNTQPGAQTSTPPHLAEIQQAQLSTIYQRQQQQQQMMPSSMPYVSQPNGNLVRPLPSNLLGATLSPRQNLNISGRSSPAPNLSNSQPAISRPGSSQQLTAGGPASSPPAMSNAASPSNTTTTNFNQRHITSRSSHPKPTGQSIGMSNSNAGSPANLATSPHPVVASLAPQSSPAALRPSPSPAPPNERSLSPNPASTKTAAYEPSTKAPQLQQSQATGNLQSKPPASVHNLTSQQHTAIAAQQQHQTGAQTLPPTTGSAVVTSNQAAQPITQDPPNVHPTPPTPVAFPAPRPTLTGGHVTSSTLAGSFLHQPPTHGINETSGHSHTGLESSSRSADATSANRIISKRKIQELVESIDPSERLETEVEDLLLELADEFIDSVTRFSCQLAKHRKSDRLETKDIQLHLERSWNIRIPGFANDEIRQSQSRRINALPSYQSRVAMVRESIRKRRP